MHDITEKDSLFYAGRTPWHKLGKYVGEDVLTAQEAIIAAGLDWTVSKKSMYDELGNEIVDINGRPYKRIVRDDTGDVMQIATDAYMPIQNTELFHDIFDEVVGTGCAKYEVAGSLQGGKKIWILARLKELDFNVKGKDNVQAYMLLLDSKDGSTGCQMFETPIRGVCANTVRAAVSDRRRRNGAVAHFKHTKNYRNKIDAAKEIFATAREYYANYREQARMLASKQMEGLELDAFLNTLLKMNDDEEKNSTRAKNQKQELVRLFHTGMGNELPEIRGTKWAAFNAVTEYVDYERSTRGDSGNRLASSWVGSGQKMRQDAFELLTK